MNKLHILKLSLLTLSLVAMAGSPVAAARMPLRPVPPPTAPTGNDISFPQCGSNSLPSGYAFGIVGVNGGLASTTNSCLSSQLGWAAEATGMTNQPKVQLYVNTADPGQVINEVTDWPTSNIDPAGNVAPNPDGTCNGTNSLACSWQYGWNRAEEDASQRFVPAAMTAGVSPNPASYTWWLDVETGNTWETGSAIANQDNLAELQGMAAYFGNSGAKVGLYSTSSQWSQVVGKKPVYGNLAGLYSWLAGASNQTTAKNDCSLSPLTTGGTVILTQYVSTFDYDYSCIH